MADQTIQIDTAIFGGGCFWGLEAVFQRVRGVRAVTCGYAGGHLSAPDHAMVCGGNSGHAEVVRIDYDPGEVAYADLLAVFFAIHDPTTRDRQGQDVGCQYRSVVFAVSDDQELWVREAIEAIDASGQHADPVVTEVEPASRFWPADDADRDYYLNHASEPYCQLVVAPKLTLLQTRFTHLVAG
ncbi:MAG: peptide-methionine (S)-S-oxide reductase MsrA [Rhodocyclaceae bacterium]|nr:peptide-methionine (S)-S-oxide reductase MsrA [Rhodocyclaceae bacterium]